MDSQAQDDVLADTGIGVTGRNRAKDAGSARRASAPDAIGRQEISDRKRMIGRRGMAAGLVRRRPTGLASNDGTHTHSGSSCPSQMCAWESASGTIRTKK